MHLKITYWENGKVRSIEFNSPWIMKLITLVLTKLLFMN